ncbi:hypothetical protein OUZ56_021899 [Daphnia magna]|uniref:Neuroblastoma-amplified sequence n=1 Tax=Daphnia magna TaxID=35525 RepID=A0ABR0AUS6_9CRUS|nr:hypothetical protein OUZ56_021899 [Daphnia magna]
MGDITGSIEESILYELLVLSEWSQEQDVPTKGIEEPYWSWKNISRYLRKSHGGYYISNWINQQLPWLFAVGSNGKTVAVLQDNALEIRTSRDHYAVPIGKVHVAKDPFQQWRKLEWSPDGTLLAIAHSSGSVDVYDLLATQLFVIPAPKGTILNNSSNDVPTNALAGLAFVDTRTKNAHWSYELLCLDHYGQLRAFLVSPTQGFQESHTFSFASHLPYGITACCADQSRNLLVLASPTVTSYEPNDSGKKRGVPGTTFALTSWRLIDELPFYSETPDVSKQLSNQWLQSFQKKHYGNTIVKLSISMDGSSLAAIHFSGAVSVWSLPSLKCQHFWPLDRQPGFDEMNPGVLQLPAHRRVRSPIFQNPYKFHPIDVNWWSKDSLILARCSGAVSVCAVSDLRNKLGSSAEFFEGSPRVSPAFDSTFLGLECEMKVRRKRLQPTTDDINAAAVYHDNEDDEPSEDEDKTFMAHRAVRSLLFWATDSERFRPPRKRPKLLTRTYRLLGFKKTTPDELYLWKLDAEEYGEALALARAYSLDCDLVYQRQWRNAPATIATIHDYLSKVTKRNWVLRECLERVPTDIDAARELLLYGLKNTDLGVVADVEGGGRNEATSIPFEFQETEAEIQRKEEEQNRRWLEQIDFDNLTVQQKMLISTRRRLLQFLDRLSIYEVILGGPHVAGQRFDPSFFEDFRSQTALESTAGFARQGEWQAVAVMFTFIGPQTLPHRLAVCSCFPETIPPFEYRSVLPECDVGGEVFLWEQQELRKSDWCECPAARIAVDADRVLEMEAVELFYSEEAKEFARFRSPGVELTMDIVSSWYRTRAADIEKQCMLVENALDLIKLGLERNVPHLEHIHHQLLTLETLVYDLQCENVTLEKLNAMSELSVCQFIMDGCDADSFLPKLHRWLMPYLRRLDTLHPGRINQLLRSLLVVSSQENLDWALQICTNSKADHSSPIISDAKFLISLALECIYACQKTDQLEVAMKIYDCLPERPSDSKRDQLLSELHDQLDQLQSHLEAADILENYDVAITPATISTKQNDEEQLEQLFVRLTRSALRKGETQTENKWKELLEDMLELQRKVFRRISPQLCYEILVGSLLSSAKKESITSAGLMLELNPNADSHPSQSGSPSKIPFERSKELILQAAEEYFNSSENLSDPGLELASYCLGLITIDDKKIQEEKDLISAIHLLYEFGLDMPPLKIRLSRNRLLLVDQVLKRATKAYKNSSRLLRLGHLLRACDNGSFTDNEDCRKELEGQIYVRIAETALMKQDLDVAGQMCCKLRLANRPVGWKVCSRLAKLEELTNLSMKLELVSYSLTYCPAESIEELLQLQWHLEHTKLEEECNKQIKMYMNYENGDESLLARLYPKSVEAYRQDVAKKHQNLVTTVSGGTMPQQVLLTTADTTRQLVNVVRSSLKLKEHRQPENGTQRTRIPSTSEDNKECIRWGLPVFYWDVWCNNGIGLHESRLSASYRLFSMPELVSSELDLLMWSWRMLVLDSLKEPYARNRPRGDVLAKLAESLFPSDCLLAIGHLLDLEVEEAWEPLTRLPSTEITLQMAAYYFSLRMVGFSSGGSLADAGQNFVALRPRCLIHHCLSISEKGLSKEQAVCRDFLRRALRLLADVSEAQQLRRLDGGVDINRFTTDDTYKRDTIVGLAITTDPAVYSAAVRLAAHYDVSAWEVTFSHLTALFAEDKITPGHIVKYMDEHRMRDILYSDVQSFGSKMVDVIYPSISGRDHGRLLLFFQLLNSNSSTAECMTPHAPVYIQILRKLECVKDVDVKKLTRSAQGFAQEIEKAATAENVPKLVKLAQLISRSVKELSPHVSQATVHSIWTRKYFFALADEGKTLAVSDWLQRLESCKTHINKLDAEEFSNLVGELCFSERSLDALTLDIRTEICRRCVKMAKERGRSKTNPDANQVFETYQTRIEKWVEHLERLRSEEYAQIRTEVVSSAGSQFWREFEKSRAEEMALHRLLLRMLVERQPLSVVRLLVGIFPPDFSSTPEDVLIDAIRLTLDFLRLPAESDKSEHELDGKDAMQVLLHLLNQVAKVLDARDGAGLFSRSDIGEMMSQFYDDDTIDVQTRLQLMLMLKTLPADFIGLSETGSRVQWLRTLALIQQSWSSNEHGMADSNNIIQDLEEDDLKSAGRRRTLFDRLLEMSHNINHLTSLAKLLHFWPPFESESDPNSTPWVILWIAITKMTPSLADAYVLDTLKLALEQKPPLSDQCIRVIYQTVSSLPSVGAIPSIRLRLHVALRSSLSFLLDDVIRFVSETKELNEEDYDQEILDLILEQGLMGRLAGTPLYAPLCERLLSSPQPASRVQDVARQLVDHNRLFEAGHLLQLTNGLPRYLLNLSTSLYFARKRL